jgi:hypothetical protein
MKTAAVNVPRIDCNPLSGQPNGLLIEESRTNLLKNSQNLLASSWSPAGITLNSPSIAAPDGSTLVNTITEDTSTGGHIIDNAVAASTNAVYTYSVYVKRTSGTRSVQVALYDNNAPANLVLGIFDPSACSASAHLTYGTATFSSTSAILVANNWCRISLTGQPSTASDASILVRTWIYSGTNGSNYAGDGSSGLYIWGAQLEAGTFATSYIPTSSTSVARAADFVDLSSTFGTWMDPAVDTFVIDGQTEYASANANANSPATKPAPSSAPSR